MLRERQDVTTTLAIGDVSENIKSVCCIFASNVHVCRSTVHARPSARVTRSSREARLYVSIKRNALYRTFIYTRRKSRKDRNREREREGAGCRGCERDEVVVGHATLEMSYPLYVFIRAINRDVCFLSAPVKGL